MAFALQNQSEIHFVGPTAESCQTAALRHGLSVAISLTSGRPKGDVREVRLPRGWKIVPFDVTGFICAVKFQEKWKIGWLENVEEGSPIRRDFGSTVWVSPDGHILGALSEFSELAVLEKRREEG